MEIIRKRKIEVIVCCVLALFCLSGCGKAKTVPDKTIEWVVEDFLNWNSDRGGLYTDYSYTVSHDPDKNTNTDTIIVNLTVWYPHQMCRSEYRGTYQYNRASDNWGLSRDGYWDELMVWSFDISDSEQEWLNSLEYQGVDIDSCEVKGLEEAQIMVHNILSADLEKEQESLSEKATKMWTIKGMTYNEATAKNIWLQIQCIVFADTESADSFVNLYSHYCHEEDPTYLQSEVIDNQMVNGVYRYASFQQFLDYHVVEDRKINRYYVFLQTDKKAFIITSNWELPSGDAPDFDLYDRYQRSCVDRVLKNMGILL